MLCGKLTDVPVQVHAPPHPVLRHWLAIARSKDSPSPIFRSACAEIGRLLLYEATNNWLPTVDIVVKTPVGSAPSTIVDPTRPVKVRSGPSCKESSASKGADRCLVVQLIPILRAGLILLENAATMLPASQTFHVGYVRNEETLQVRCPLGQTLLHCSCAWAAATDPVTACRRAPT